MALLRPFTLPQLTMVPEVSDDEPDFSKPWEFSDMVLVVEKGKVFCSKLILMGWSPVFMAMFKHGFQESKATEVMLPDKKFDDILLLMKVIHNVGGDINITAHQANQLLPVAHEYQMQRLLSQCEAVLLQQAEPSMNLLLLADRFSLLGLADSAARCLEIFTLDEVERMEEYKSLAPTTKVVVLRHKLLQEQIEKQEAMDMVMKAAEDDVRVKLEQMRQDMEGKDKAIQRFRDFFNFLRDRANLRPVNEQSICEGEEVHRTGASSHVCVRMEHHYSPANAEQYLHSTLHVREYDPEEGCTVCTQAQLVSIMRKYCEFVDKVMVGDEDKYKHLI